MKDFNLKKKILTLTLIIGFNSMCFGQSDATWAKFNWLMGEWVGEGVGQPGQGNGTFSFKFDLDKHILVRRSQTIFPKDESKPEIIHDDLMIIYPDISGDPSTAIYFDNEGHTINYFVQCSEKAIIFTSSKIQDATVFRLTYTLIDNKMINTKFEMSRDGEKFKTYVEGNSKKLN